MNPNKRAEHLYQSLATDSVGATSYKTVEASKSALLAAINGLPLNTLRERIECGCAALGSLSAGMIITAIGSTEKQPGTVGSDDVADAIMWRVEYWMRENIKLHFNNLETRKKKGRRNG